MSSSDNKYIEDEFFNLSELFNEGLRLFENLECCDEATNSLDVQVNIRRIIKIFERATILCSFGDIFSKNEGIEEVSSTNLKYFLLPAILGSLQLKLTSGERRNIVEVSEVYFRDFIQRCAEYGLCQYKLEKSQEENNDEPLKESDELEELMVLAKRRALKIVRYKKQQELKEKLAELKANIENEDADEDVKRNYFLTMIQLYIYEVREELSSLEFEKKLLDHMDKLNKNKKTKAKKRLSPPLRPVIITKDALQKTFYDSFYSSLVALPVGEFRDRRQKCELFSVSNKLKQDFDSQAYQQGTSHDYNEKIDALGDFDTDDYHILEAMQQVQNLKCSNQGSWSK